MKTIRIEIGKLKRFIVIDQIEMIDFFQAKDGKYYIKFYGKNFEQFQEDPYKKPFIMVSFENQEQLTKVQTQLKENGLI